MIRYLILSIYALQVTCFVHRSSQKLSNVPSTRLHESVVVISPPGGVGEVAAVKSAALGSSVKWFVVSPAESPEVVLSQEALESVKKAGGKIELAGAEPTSLLLPSQDSKSSLSAVSKWCGSADSMICTFDGVQEMKGQEGGGTAWKSAIKVAAKEASSSIRGRKIAILPPDDDGETEIKEQSGVSKVFGSVFGASGLEVPKTIAEAMGGDVSSIYSIRHGTLFGVPESSPDFSPLVGGPRRGPELCEEYTSRAIRIDPAISASGNTMLGLSTRSSRLSVGEISALLASGKVEAKAGLDVCVSSLSGTSAIDVEDWKTEFARIEKIMSSKEAFQLFTFDFSSVPNIERLTDWVATKWAPAVLRTYEIATIRSGARPVYANKVSENQVEVVWQELVNFESKTVGKMIIEVREDGLIASRGAGIDGTISRKPLNGEDVLVRQLAEAASQAVAKGLAERVQTKEIKVEKTSSPQVKVSPAAAVQSSAPASQESGPRPAGARRPTQRTRGTSRAEE